MREIHAPGKVDDLDTALLGRWRTAVASILGQSLAVSRSVTGRDPWFVNLVTDEVVRDAPTRDIAWSAFPRRRPGQHRAVDADRQAQDEYCEWEVARDDEGRVARVTLTTEVPDYYDFLHDNAESLLLNLYHRFVSPEVTLEDLRAPDGSYDPSNRWNLGGGGRGTVMHMAQANNTLAAAAALVAIATWPVVDPDGDPVVSTPSLIACLRFGDAGRHSDPHIGAQVNELVRAGHKVSLADPVGLHFDSVDLSAFDTPDGSSIMGWHRFERGADGFRTRLVFEAPPGGDAVLGDVRVDGVPIRFGGQVAEKVRVRVGGAAAKVDDPPPVAVVCGGVNAERVTGLPARGVTGRRADR